MHQVIGDRHLVIRRIRKLEEVFVVRKVHEGEFIALGGFFLLPKFEANFFVKLDGFGWFGDANACVKELNHTGESGEKWVLCEVCSCGRAAEALEIPRLEIV